MTTASDDPLRPIPHPELFFGIIGPVGADLDTVCDVLSAELKKADYRSYTIRLSSLITTLEEYQHLGKLGQPEHIRIKKLMEAGTEIRKKTTRGDILALMAVAAVRDYREKAKGTPNNPLEKQAYIFRSLKHPDEISALRDIYGRLLIVVSVHAPRETRVATLSKLSASSCGNSNTDKFRQHAEELINIDEEEEGTSLGQNVSQSFPLADFFVDAKNRQTVKKSISRFIEILFGHPYHTPSHSEMGMYFAKSAALRSADLSRQVGAAIANAPGEIISIGCNEVPRALGGLYWPDSRDDGRDFQLGYDSSTSYKKKIVTEVVERFWRNNFFNKETLKAESASEITDLILSETGHELLKGTQIFSLLEFGRAVHAEMAAISEAAKRGVSVEGCTLYSTTFPCHLCARHIIAAGIRKVIYIEPYPKSRVKELYEDSVVIDPNRENPNKVNFIPFVGIAPGRYQEFFKIHGPRKDDQGCAIEFSLKDGKPIVKRLILTYLQLEERIVSCLGNIFSVAAITLRD